MVVGGTKFDKEAPIVGYTEFKTHNQSVLSPNEFR